MSYKKGMGDNQFKRTQVSNLKIAEFLLDGQPHQYSEIKKATELSGPTLSKRLKELVGIHLIQKKVDTTSGKYPYPVFYTASGELIDLVKSVTYMDTIHSNIEGALAESKDPLYFLNMLHMANEAKLILTLMAMKKDRSLLESDVKFKWELFVLEPYRKLSWEIIRASSNMIDEIDLDKIQDDHFKMEKLVSTLVLGQKHEAPNSSKEKPTAKKEQAEIAKLGF